MTKIYMLNIFSDPDGPTFYKPFSFFIFQNSSLGDSLSSALLAFKDSEELRAAITFGLGTPLCHQCHLRT